MRQPRFDVYQDRKGEWRWRLYAANGRTIADSGEGYTRKADADRAVAMVKKVLQTPFHKWDCGIRAEATKVELRPN